jgi:hypothetical protein
LKRYCTIATIVQFFELEREQSVQSEGRGSCSRH